MDLLSLITKAEIKHGAHKESMLAFVALSLLNQSASLSLLEDKKTIEEKLNSSLETQDSTPKLYGKKIIDEYEAPEEIRKVIAQLCKDQQRILACPTADEHVLLLACLKGLEKNFPDLYKNTLKEILTKQLHRMQQTQHASHLVGRKKELEHIANILSRSERNSVLIIGPSGVGKTTLAQGISTVTSDKTILRLFPGETLFDQMIQVLSTAHNPIIFFLDELPAFSMEHVQYLLDNGHIIATANDTGYKKLLSDFPHVMGKFEILNLEEPVSEELQHIFLDKLTQLQEKHEVAFEEGILDELTTLTKQYIHEPAFPAKGLQLLEEITLSAYSRKQNIVTKEQLKIAISEKTNIPIASLTELDKKDLSLLPEKLKTKVKGQDNAVIKVATNIQRARIGFKKPNKPIGSFLFVGPSGVGKTELAKAVAKEVFGDEEAMVRLDMSEFAEAHMVQRLIGSPPGYIGFEEGGQLTNPVKEKPYTLILLDEIEKAHPRVFDIFLQVLDDGRLTDGQGKKVDFRNTIIVATSNAGIEDMLDMISEGKTHEEIEKEIKEILSDYFRIEFINRFDGIVIFDPLNTEALVSIGRLQIQKLQSELQKRKIELSVSDKTLLLLAEQSNDPRYGARGLLRLLQDTIENKLAEMIIANQLQEGQKVEF